MHTKNKHQSPYNFKALVHSSPRLAQFIIQTKHDKPSVNFFDPKAVLALNQALLKHHYQVEHWDLPENYLCPPIPARVDYIHTAADLLVAHGSQKVPRGQRVKCLDIGTGANCIYPLLGHQIYDWEFVASDIDDKALTHVKKLLSANGLGDKIELRLQENKSAIFNRIIHSQEIFALSFCNPPFHASAAEAFKSTQRKERNLTGTNSSQSTHNFGGQANELWCKGGERAFVQQMISESKTCALNCLWFTSLVSKEKNLPSLEKSLSAAGVEAYKILPMTQGNKKSRVIAWTFFTPTQQKKYLALLNS